MRARAVGELVLEAHAELGELRLVDAHARELHAREHRHERHLDLFVDGELLAALELAARARGSSA